MTSVSKNVYINKSDNTVIKCNNKYHRTFKMKPVDVKSSTYIVFRTENNKNPKFKGYASEEDFVITKIKNSVPWTLSVILMVKKL